MTLAHEVAGTGPAVLFLHSSVGDRRMWDQQWPAVLAAGYRAVRCDFPGFGESPVATEPRRDADEVRDLLAGLGIDQPVVVASSYGGRVALELAARWPDLVRALLLLCPSRPGRPLTDGLRAFGEREDDLLAAGDLTGAVELNVRTWLGPDADEAARDKVRIMQRHSFELPRDAPDVLPPEVEIDLARITAPGLVYSGAHDLPDFQDLNAELPSLVPTLRHVRLPWAGHLPNLERPAEATDLLLDFLRSL